MKLKIPLKTFTMAVAASVVICLAAPATFAADKPNILVNHVR